MPFIKKLVMQGFKSFPKKTEMIFTPKINVILGPNGSGKSNISEALCFVLGRLSIKSIRASKAGNLIFMGTKSTVPSKEAMVEIIFDNSDRVFTINSDEVSIKRIVRKKGSSIYKINNETKTRQDILLLLAQAGIDPNGFNIILQWEIQNFVRMPSNDRRKIIEEVSGISVYESRKEKALRELEKTEEKLKEVLTILRERTSYLNNLEKERQLALKYKKLELDVKRLKASIINSDLTKKRKEMEKLDSEILKRKAEIEKIRKIILNITSEVGQLDSKINLINSTMQKSFGFNQEKLNQEIAKLMADLAGLEVRIENYQNKEKEILRQRQELESVIRLNESSISELQKEPLRKKQQEVEMRKNELDSVEKERKRFYTLKSEIKSLRERIEDKRKILQSYDSESELLVRQTESISSEMFDKKTTSGKLNQLKSSVVEKEKELAEIEGKESEIKKFLYSSEGEIARQEKLMERISKMDICPLCKSRITKDHVSSMHSDSKSEIKKLKESVESLKEEIEKMEKQKISLKDDLKNLGLEMSNRESDLLKLSSINEKKEQIKSINAKAKILEAEISRFESSMANLERAIEKNSDVEQKYEKLRLEVEEISMRTRETVDSEVSFKQRELERAKISINQLSREKEDITEELSAIQKDRDEKESLLNEKREKEEELSRKFKELISEREGFETEKRKNESKIMESQNSIKGVEHEVNTFSIDKARLGAEIENFETEIIDFKDVELVGGSRETLMERLERTKQNLSGIGSVNLLSLDVYDSVKKQYDQVNEKVEIIKKEKEDILKVIHEIDIKKKKTFMKTFNSLNETFSRNFSTLSPKGIAMLELENAKDPFAEGISITIKTGHGKYLDVTSLSGGERVLVALSLIFAIQELSPYYFYILDEVDASLDKRNSERLANLFTKYMQRGQYIIITHNDEIISNATNLYGVSMNEGVSKIVSMRV